MRKVVGLIALSCLAGSAQAQTTAHPTAKELRHAIEDVVGHVVEAKNLHVGVCHGPEEEPTEFECSWHQRIGGRWRRLSGWFFVDAKGWHSQCPVGHSMECFGIKADLRPTE
jgi:hypothetical protein